MRNLLLLALLPIASLLISCTDGIPGHPDRLLAEYIKGVQNGDHKTVFRLNHLTARRLKYLGASDREEDRKVMAMQIDEWRSAYESAPAHYDSAQRWNDKNIFPSSASAIIGKPYEYKAVGDDPVNAEYVKGSKVIVPVTVTYAANERLMFSGKKVRTARFDCILGKIRGAKNVRTYSHDDRWYITTCIIDPESVQTGN